MGAVHNKLHLPVGIPVTDGLPDYTKLTKWWAARSIPASRSGLRHILETLNVPVAQALAKECYGLSLSDQYWIRPENSGLAWESINFFDNAFSEDVGNILFGGKISGAKPDLISPDSTSDGQLKKRWSVPFKYVKQKPFAQGDDIYAHFLDCCDSLGIPDMRDSLDKMLTVGAPVRCV